MTDPSIDTNEIRRQTLERLEQAGNRKELLDFIRHRLVESGFRDTIKVYVKELVDKRGLESVTIDEFAEEITNYARTKVPPEIKQDLLQKLREILSSE
ncbi:hypothetical protein GEMRC1_007711 [Eukaryota sp. GEM-RC1]